MMKKEYERPTINISVFSAENIVTDSGIEKAYTALLDGGINKENIRTVNFETVTAFRE